MTEDELLKIVRIEYQNSIGVPGQQVSQERALAVRRYMSKLLGNEVDGQSEAVTSDVADVVDSIMPSLMRVFGSDENLVMFDPVGPEDVAAAEQETDYVNHVFWKDNKNSFLDLFYWMHDALLQKFGIARAWWNENTRVTQETYEIAEADLPEFLDNPELEPIERDERENEDGSVTHIITFKVKQSYGKCCWESIRPEDFRISADALYPSGDNIRLVGLERLMTRSDLISMGFQKAQVMELSPDFNEEDSTEKAEKRSKADYRNQKRTDDKSQDTIRVREAYIMADYDDDGVAELRQVYTGDDKILKWADGTLANEVVDRQPFHILTAYPLPHQSIGLSVDDKVGDLQDQSTTILRQVLNNLYHTNQPSHAVWEQGMSENTMDDLLSGHVGGIKRFARPPGEAHSVITVPFTAGASFPMLEYMDKVKRERTGIHSDAEGLSPDALKNIQQSVMADANDMARMKTELIARIFAETGIKSLFMHLHELLLKHQDRARVVALKNRFVPVDPREWKKRENMTVKVGIGMGTRERKLLMLEHVSGLQAQMAAGGLQNLTVTPKNIYNTASEMVRLADLKDADMYFTDPGDQPMPPPSDEAQELQKKEQQLEERRQQLDAQKFQVEVKKLELRNQELQMQHQRELMKIEGQAADREDKFWAARQKLLTDLDKLQQDVRKNETMLPVEREKMLADIEESLARARQADAIALKTLEEARGQDITNDATVSGITELIGADEETDED